jgi:PHD/YefM family antitoxin component YafN of YafNO toxin-antitoxin module
MQTEGNEKLVFKNVQYVTDDEGHRTAVIVPIREFEEMMEDLHLARVARESTSEPRRPFLEMVEEMRQAGEIDV